MQRLEEAHFCFSPPHHRHISLLIAITLNLPRCLNINSQLMKRGSPQVDGIKSFFFFCSNLPLAHCESLTTAVPRRPQRIVSPDCEPENTEAARQCPMTHGSEAPRAAATVNRSITITSDPGILPRVHECFTCYFITTLPRFNLFLFFSQPFRIIIPLRPWS